MCAYFALLIMVCFFFRHEKDQCSHFPALDYLSRVQVINVAAKHVLVCNACHVSPTAAGRCLGFINEQSRCEKACTGDELFCCAEHGENVKLVDQKLTDDVTEETDRGSSDRYRGSKREALWYASGGNCHYCETRLNPNNWHADHKHPVALGGQTTLANGVAACPPCNLRKADMPYKEFCREEGISPR